MNKKIILATTSPHRIGAFGMLGIPFTAEGSEVDEYFDGRPSGPEDLVLRLAKLKAEAVAANQKEPSIIIGFDSVGWFDGKILEKPKSRNEALARLKKLSDNQYQFYTGVHIIDGNRVLSKSVYTAIIMRKLTDAEINRYLDQDPNYTNYAQGYDPLATYGATFIKKIHGSYNNPLRGIPLEVIIEMLEEIGYQI